MKVTSHDLRILGIVIHSGERFKIIVDGLNQTFDGLTVFQLVGSLAEKPASYNDGDIVVYPRIPFNMKGFSHGCKDNGIEILAVDKTSITPFPGRPKGQDRIQVRLSTGDIIDLFLPKGSLP